MVSLYNDAFSKASLYNYIVSQGLTKMTKVNLGGGYWIVYFSPTDIKGAKVPTSQTVAMPTEAVESFNYSDITKDNNIVAYFRQILLFHPFCIILEIFLFL